MKGATVLTKFYPKNHTSHLDPVVQKVDSAIRHIIAIQWMTQLIFTYPLDSDLSDG